MWITLHVISLNWVTLWLLPWTRKENSSLPCVPIALLEHSLQESVLLSLDGKVSENTVTLYLHFYPQSLRQGLAPPRYTEHIFWINHKMCLLKYFSVPNTNNMIVKIYCCSIFLELHFPEKRSLFGCIVESRKLWHVCFCLRLIFHFWVTPRFSR